MGFDRLRAIFLCANSLQAVCNITDVARSVSVVVVRRQMIRDSFCFESAEALAHLLG
jgi:hypothetical protein